MRGADRLLAMMCHTIASTNERANRRSVATRRADDNQPSVLRSDFTYSYCDEPTELSRVGFKHSEQMRTRYSQDSAYTFPSPLVLFQYILFRSRLFAVRSPFQVMNVPCIGKTHVYYVCKYHMYVHMYVSLPNLYFSHHIARRQYRTVIRSTALESLSVVFPCLIVYIPCIGLHLYFECCLCCK